MSLLKATTNKITKRYGEEKVNELSSKQQSLKKEVEELEGILEKSQEEALSLEQFLNLSENAYTVVKNWSPEVKDTICRFIFLNIEVGVNEILSY